MLLPLLLSSIVPCTARAAEPAPIHHDLAVRLDLAGHALDVTDRITLPDPDTRELRFVLHAGLHPEVRTRGWELQPVEGPVTADFFGINATTANLGEDVPLEGWRLVATRKKPRQPVTLHYEGPLDHPLAQSGAEYQRSFTETPGTIGPDGVFLAGASYWVPDTGPELFTFDLQVDGLQPPWDVVSQGTRTVHDLAADGTRTTRYEMPWPTDEAYLVAGPWHEYDDTAPRADGSEIATRVFLRSDDPGLAARYLQATRRYLSLYEGILPPYPYESFALVENSWETGYGMPGFTLLGPQVIRFPWVITTSYPHELLHNWWGNSVYVDPAGGNWCEGLTAYMADHLFAEDKGEGARYRRSTLQKYTDFVRGERDFPLVQFGSRSSAASEAVGYGKALMMFHMVRRAMGDEDFLAALGAFYEAHAFERVSFGELADAFTARSGQDWGPFIESWTTRTGAPVLSLGEVHVAGEGDTWTVRIDLEQTGVDTAFPMTVPVAISVEGEDEAVVVEVPMDDLHASATARVSGRPLRVDVDPGFDVMRRLDPLELPPALSTLFGADQQVFVMPSSASDEEQAAWTALAEQWARPGSPTLLRDDEIDALPPGSVWVLGWDNRFAPAVAGTLAADGVALTADGLDIGDEHIDRAGHSAVLVTRGSPDPATAVGWVGADPVAAIPGLARKLPHYTRYSYLGFAGDEPQNSHKGTWQARTSPLSRDLSGEGAVGEPRLPERRPLAELPSLFDATLLARTVRALASPEMGGRGLGSAELEQAATLVEQRLAELGLEPAGDHGYRQTLSWDGGPPVGTVEITNLLARIPGTDPALADHPVVVMAHLDHLGTGWPDVREGNEGRVHPGADDNASGVAIALELARVMIAEGPRPRPVLFAFTSGEEAGLVGARHLLAGMAEDALPAACVNLDTVGRLGDGKLLVIDGGSAREWPFIFMGAGYVTGVQTAMVDEPLDSSDQAACLEHGVPAVQLFTGPNEDYHRPSDTVDKLDVPGMVKVAEVAHQAVAYLAERAEPLTSQLAGAGGHDGRAAGPGSHGGGRTVSLGTRPDFAFEGEGVRVDAVTAGSPADQAGMRAGDVVVAIDGQPIDGLRTYSDVLKRHQPGDTIRITVQRGGTERTLEATLVRR
ncbi:MAG: M20/M25/M40 family metallo-hydrolase [Deltaproteobacteria bacterium]|nr:MAG: M20/M25/M40 family metallo-hydrolase [Deltaproteobacteria bacterium]